MTDNATPKRKIIRPIRYPAAIPRTMTTKAQRAELDRIAERDGATLGEVVRNLIDGGLLWDDVTRATRDDVDRLAAAGGYTRGQAVEMMLVFAAREADKRAGKPRDITLEF